MKAEITIQDSSPNNITIICSIKPTIHKQLLKKCSLRKLRCGYKVIPKLQLKNPQCLYRQISNVGVINNKNTLKSQCRKYLSSIQNSICSIQNSSSLITNEEKSTLSKSNQEINLTQKNKKRDQKLQLLYDPIAVNLFNEYRTYCSNNLMKNIKEAFMRHVIFSNDQAYFEKLVDNQMTFSQIKRKLLLLKQVQSENKVIKTICKHQYMNILFKDFLERAEDEWLPNSKVQQKEQCQQMIKFLLKIIGQLEYIEVIEDYKK